MTGRRLLLAGLAPALAAVLLTVVVLGGATRGVDGAVARPLHDAAVGDRVLVDAAAAVSDVGSPVWWYALMGVAVVLLLLRRRRRLAVYLAVSELGAGVLSTLVKHLTARVRPVWLHPVAYEPSYAYPSGHALWSTVGYGALLVVVLGLLPRSPGWRRPATTAAAALAVAGVCFSRLVLGVHWLTDVVAGVLIGLAWLAVTTAVLRRGRRLHR